MRRLLVLAVVTLGLVACGSQAGNTVGVKFGIQGGNILPYRIVIAPGGAVTFSGAPPVQPKALSAEKDSELSGLVRKDFPQLTTKLCAHTPPDVASQYITAFGRTVRMHGACDARFTQLWQALANAFSLNA